MEAVRIIRIGQHDHFVDHATTDHLRTHADLLGGFCGLISGGDGIFSHLHFQYATSFSRGGEATEGGFDFRGEACGLSGVVKGADLISETRGGDRFVGHQPDQLVPALKVSLNRHKVRQVAPQVFNVADHPHGGRVVFQDVVEDGLVREGFRGIRSAGGDRQFDVALLQVVDQPKQQIGGGRQHGQVIDDHHIRLAVQGEIDSMGIGRRANGLVHDHISDVP